MSAELAAPCDEAHMARALELAALGLYTTDPNPRVGCVLVREGQVIGEGWHRRAGEPHAEVMALRSVGGLTGGGAIGGGARDGGARDGGALGGAENDSASKGSGARNGGAERGGEQSGGAKYSGEPDGVVQGAAGIQLGGDARGATAYVTLEPCSHTGRTPPCADALIAAGIARVVCASQDPNPKVAGGGIKRLEEAGVAVIVGVLEAEARTLNVGFFSRFERGRPFIRLKLAMSLDARTAAVAGEKAWISGEASRADVQLWRARSSAVLTGAGTVRVDNPRLDVRLDYGSWVRQPLRIVLDPDLSCDPGSAVFRDGGALVFAAEDAIARKSVSARVEFVERIEGVARAGRGLDVGRVVERLAVLEINELLVECGPRLAAAFLEADLVDELILYVAPHFLGAQAPPLAALADARSLESLRRFEFREHRLIQDDLRLVLTPKRA
jgi:diaminohydroxyphosphoribosylaminopyrimidine deaminase / 5-amino-6-(5-phosphoribosylamino)uracil reductase